MFKELIRHNFLLLLRCLDITNDLLIELLSVVSVNNRLSVIDQHMTNDDKVNAFLTALLEIPDDFDEYVMNNFIVALRNSGQDHVANIFRRESDKVPMSVEHCEILDLRRYELCQFLDPENGLLDKLVSNGVISRADSRRIRNKVRTDIMAGELIDTVLKKSDDAFQSLIQALNETGQSHVTFILTGQGSSRPLNETLLAKLRSNKHYIVTTMEAKNSGLVSALITKGVFSQYDALRVTNKYHEVGIIINETILDLLMRKSESSFYSFFEVLNDSGQKHVSAVLQIDLKPNISTSGKTTKRFGHF